MSKSLQGMMFLGSWLALALSALGQQAGTSKASSSSKGPTSSAVVQTYSTGMVASSRQVQTRTESPGREVTTQVIEIQGQDGRFRTYRDATTETTGIGTNSVQSIQRIYSADADGRRILLETTQADQNVVGGGTTRTVEDTWRADLNGHLGLYQRQIVEEKAVSPTVKEKDTSIFRPGVNEPVTEQERYHETERHVSKDVVQNESTRFARAGNGQFRAVETMTGEVRKTGPTASVEEKTVKRIDANGTLNPAERTVTRRSSSGGREEVVTENYMQAASQPTGQLELNNRIRTTTTATSDGGYQMVQELERHDPAPNGPLKVVERTEETVRAVGPDRWETQRQVYRLDANGRFVPTVGDQGQSVGK